MIINNVSAENVLKYRRLELDDLPERGLIAISGQNESGKSSIGETICFALFGRTFSVGPEDITKIIRWGEVECSARLTFTAGGKKYDIVRFLDSDGNHSARINPADEPDNSIARGVEPVRQKLYELIGYDYDHFIDSFYLAQREITAPHAHGYTIKTMAGIAPLEKCMRVFEDEMEAEESSIAETETQAEEFALDLKELDLDPQLLPSLEKQYAELKEQTSAEAVRTEALHAASADYQENIGKLWSAKSKKGSAGFLRGLFLLLALLSGGVWALLTQFPESGAAKSISEKLAAMPQWNESMVAYLLAAAIFFGLLFVVFWVRKSGKKKLVDEFGHAVSRLSGELERIAGVMPAMGVAGAGAMTLAGNDHDDRARPVADAVLALRQRVDNAAASAREVKEVTDAELTWAHDQLKIMRAQTEGLEGAIDVERQRVEKSAQLREITEGLGDKVTHQKRRVAQRDMARDLLIGASKYISKRFNQDLRGLVGATLPLLTEGRYEHLQIDEDLTVRAFSSQKRDFLSLDEISSGTQRQIMLAVRLALSQELINRTVEGDQFLFLDEPFAFFDEKRTRSALSVLPGLSDEISQTWIIAQQFPDDMSFDRRVDCLREYESYPPDLVP